MDGVVSFDDFKALTANFGIGLIVFFAMLAALLPGVMGYLSGNDAVMIVGIGISVVLVILISLASSAMGTIVVAALYEYATEGQSPPHFNASNLRDAFAAS